MTGERAFLRFAGSFGVALCIVTAMLWFSLEISGFNERHYVDGRAVASHRLEIVDVQVQATTN